MFEGVAASIRSASFIIKRIDAEELGDRDGLRSLVGGTSRAAESRVWSSVKPEPVRIKPSYRVIANKKVRRRQRPLFDPSTILRGKACRVVGKERQIAEGIP